MGVALAGNIENAKKILKLLVDSLSIPVTCKIRIKRTAEETIEHVKELASTGIKAIAIHARNKHERPPHSPHPEIIKAVVDSGQIKIPIICNGGSKEIEKHADIFKFKELCGTSSIMIARAAEWNVSIFRKEGMLPIMDVIKRYLKLAIDYDNYHSNTKYCIQNMLRELQHSELGEKFLETQIMEQISDIFDMKDYCKEKQHEYQRKESEIRRELKNKISVQEEDSLEPSAKKLKMYDENTITERVAFVRANYLKDTELPKSILHLHAKQKLKWTPKYTIEKNGIVFRAVLQLGTKKYLSTLYEKNIKSAEQASAIVACLHLNLFTREELINNGSMSMFEL